MIQSKWQAEADPVKVGINWLIKQGVCSKDEPYSHNSGRKALARLLSKNNISYEHGFEIHADRHSVWQKNYQPDCASAPHFDRRDQHLNPDQTHVLMCGALLCELLHEALAWERLRHRQ